MFYRFLKKQLGGDNNYSGWMETSDGVIIDTSPGWSSWHGAKLQDILGWLCRQGAVVKHSEKYAKWRDKAMVRIMMQDGFGRMK